MTLLSRVNKYSHQNVKPVGAVYKLPPVCHATTAHSYLITKKAAENLLQALYPVWKASDKWAPFEDYGLIKVNAIVPVPVTLSAAACEPTIIRKKEAHKLMRSKKQTE